MHFAEGAKMFMKNVELTTLHLERYARVCLNVS